MRNSLVTGGAGFIGSHLVEALLVRGDNVRVLDNFSTGKEENLAGFLDQVELIRGDLLDNDDLKRAVDGVDYVFHQAAFVSVPQSLEEPDICFEINVTGTNRLLSIARDVGVKRVVLASSAAVYGENPTVPLSEKINPAPLSPYAASKRIGEIYAHLFTSQLGLEVTALRYFNVYGPRQNPASDYAAVIPIFIKKLLDEEQPVIYGDGLQSRDFIYVEDVIQANLLAAESNQAQGLVINICSGQETDLQNLVDYLAEIFSRDIQPVYQDARAGDIYRSLGDPTLARELFDFQPVTGMAEGLMETAAWLRTV
jgi:UDP-glucose 4-epimerase